MLCRIQQWVVQERLSCLLDPETLKYSESADDRANEEPKRVPVWVTFDAGRPQLADHELGFSGTRWNNSPSLRR